MVPGAGGNVGMDERKTESRIALEDGADARAPYRLSLLVMSEGAFSTFPAPDRGEVTIGRSPRCGIALSDPQLSREHARLVFGPTPSIVDLGSSNGTRVGDRSLLAHAPQALGLGDVIALGSTVIVLQTVASTARRRHLWSHGMFEARLEDECARAEQTGRTFSVVRLRAEKADAQILEDRLGVHLRPMDVVGSYAPGEYEVLLVEIDRPSAQGLVARLRAELSLALGSQVQLGIASYPRDAQTPEGLVAHAAPTRIEVGGMGGAARAPRRVVEGGAIERLRPIVERVAAGVIPVLVVGETGVGKDVLASAIHALSPRAQKPFLCLNCAALPEQLLESELFGYERGAFTGATQAKMGLLEAAEGGTAFLDEVAEMPLSVQAKLLRVLDQQEVMRIGGLKPRRTDVRFVAATNRDLEAEVARGAFREDLFYRLNGVVIVVPPLRERASEIAPLARSFASEAARQLGLPDDPTIGEAAMAALERYTWPGNIRELRNVVERAVLLSAGAAIDPTHLPLDKMGRTMPVRDSERRVHAATIAPPVDGSHRHVPADDAFADERNVLTTPRLPAPAPSPHGFRASRALTQDEQRAQVIDALARCEGNQTHAAKLLGMSRRTLISRMEAFALPRPRKAPRSSG